MLIPSRKCKRCILNVFVFIGLSSMVGFIYLVIYPDINFKLKFQSVRAGKCEDETEGHVLCLVIPFRDRFDELLVFIPHMKKFLCRQKIKNHIVIVNQQDSLRFNRGSLINIGYSVARDSHGCTYIGMHDVDLLPLNDHLPYSFPQQPFHVSAPELHPNYHYKKFVGGILLINNHHFELTNGISNLYWGWGREDDEFYLRMQQANFTVQRPTNITSGQQTFMHIHSKVRRPRDNIRFGDQKAISRHRDRKTGLDSTQYTVLSRQHLQVDSHEATMVNVQLSCDLHITPWCMTYSQLKGHVRDQQKELSSAKFDALIASLRSHKINV